jgi:translation initiation factor IF-1
MSEIPAFVVEGSVVETLPRGSLIVELANGHQLLGHVTLKQKLIGKRLANGSIVLVKLTPGDLSHGLVILNESKL